MHWLSYSNSDQALLRDPSLDGAWEALLVPGTLAAFYFEGTGGFVLARGRPYAIDPRTPLLQEVAVSRPAPRKSHLALAEIHEPEVSAFWPDREISLAFWQDGRWPDVVRRVVAFQEGYSSNATAKIDKYAALLQEATGRSLQVAPESPHRIVPPYWAVTGQNDPWWQLSSEAVAVALGFVPAARLMPIIATTRETPVATFADLLGDLPDDCERVFCWRGDWDEGVATQDDVDGWVRTIDVARRYGIEVTNLYGGYLSVLLMALGLRGLNHGVGYSEKRDVRRLSQTGAPPTRYYVPALRDFVPRASAQPVIDSLPAEWACDCVVCESVTAHDVPIIEGLSSEELKKHFLICREREIRRTTMNLSAELDQIDEVVDWLETREFTGAVPAGSAARLGCWSDSIRAHL